VAVQAATSITGEQFPNSAGEFFPNSDGESDRIIQFLKVYLWMNKLEEFLPSTHGL